VRVVHEGGNWHVATQEWGDGLAATGTEVDQAAEAVDVAAGVRPPVRELEPGVAKRYCKCVAHRPRPGHLAELDDETRDRGPCLPVPDKSAGDRQRERAKRQRLQPPHPLVEGLIPQDSARE
jgi:hypothetical protein